MAVNEADRALGRRVARARQERGLSQRALAERAGIGRDAVRRMEGAKSSAQKTTIMAVARGLGLTYEDLVPEDAGSAPPGGPLAADVLPEPAMEARRPSRRGGDDYVGVYVTGRSLEEVLEEVEERYWDKVLAARTRVTPTEDSEPQRREPEERD